MTDRELLEFVAAQVGKLTQDIGELKDSQKELKDSQKDIVKRITKIETILENDVKIKLEVLLDGYKQNAEKIDTIEKEVTKQEEIIMRRVK